MKKKRAIHYNTSDKSLAYDPACGSAPFDSDRTTDWLIVTCKNCKKTHEWKGAFRAARGKK